MKTRFITAFVLTLLCAAALLAEGPVRKTVIIRDGKMIVNGEEMPFDAAHFGGKRPHLGVAMTDLTPELRVYFGASRDSGVLVGDVEKDSPAEKAGLRVGDVIVSIDGSPVDSSSDIRRQIAKKKDNDAVRLEVLRSGKHQTLVATVIEREGVRVAMPEIDMDVISKRLNETFDSPEWRARVERLGDCEGLQSRLRAMETRLKELEKKLQK